MSFTIDKRTEHAQTQSRKRMKKIEEIKAYVAMGMTNREIALRMEMPESTVRRYTGRRTNVR